MLLYNFLNLPGFTTCCFLLDIGRTSGFDGIKLQYNAEQEEMTTSFTQDLVFEVPNLEDNNDQLGFQNLVITLSPSTRPPNPQSRSNSTTYLKRPS